MVKFNINRGNQRVCSLFFRIATLSDNSAGYSHAFDHLPGNLQGPYQRPNPDDSDSSSKPNYLSFSDIKE